MSPSAANLGQGSAAPHTEATDRLIAGAAVSRIGAAQKLQDFDAMSIRQQEAVSAAMNFPTASDFRAKLQIQAAFDRSSLATAPYAPGSIMSTKI
jgi:hypothetical protein